MKEFVPVHSWKHLSWVLASKWLNPIKRAGLIQPKGVYQNIFLLQMKVLSLLDALLTTSARCFVEQDSFYQVYFIVGYLQIININASSNWALTYCQLLFNRDVFAVFLLPVLKLFLLLTCAQITRLKETTNQKYISRIYAYTVISFTSLCVLLY